jgi:ATP-dependent Clp protease adaptor protein ClpS
MSAGVIARTPAATSSGVTAATPAATSAGVVAKTPAAPLPVETPEVAEAPDIEDVPEIDRPWVTVVWNDPINLMSYVTWVFQKLFGYSKDKAEQLMLDVHHKGRAVVSSGARERMEFDASRLHEHGLWATVTRE